MSLTTVSRLRLRFEYLLQAGTNGIDDSGKRGTVGSFSEKTDLV